MDSFQADQIINLLRDIREELRDLRKGFQEFSGYGVDKMSAVVDAVSGRFVSARELVAPRMQARLPEFPIGNILIDRATRRC